MKPTIMISSTCYDLKQIRADLQAFVQDDMGYSVLLSEAGSFPVKSDVDAVANCKLQVQELADAMVLVIGGRYGSIDKWSDKSVTNLECLTARAKRIPVFVFIDKRVNAILPVWQANPEADFGGVVESNRVFEFIEDVRVKHAQWFFEFETAQDIVAVLRSQFAILQNRGLALALKLENPDELWDLNQLKPAAFRIALEKPDSWRPRLFAQALIDEVEARKELLRELRADLAVGPLTFIKDQNVLDWMIERNAELSRYISDCEHLGNTILMKELRSPINKDSVGTLGFIARMIGRVLEELVRWSMSIRRTRVEKDAEEVLELLSTTPLAFIEQLESFGKDLRDRLEAAMSAPVEDGPVVVDFHMKIVTTNHEALMDAIARYRDRVMGR